jgi:CrcB protein
MYSILAIAAGSALGGVLRHFSNNGIGAVLGTEFPWGIMLVNIIGSFVMGIFTGLFAYLTEPSQTVRLFLTTGLLGGFTTFSTFSLDTALLIERGTYMAAGLYVAGSLVVSIAALFAGLYLMRMALP